MHGCCEWGGVSERLKFYKYDDLIACDKANLDHFWLKEDSLPPPDALQQEIIDHLEADFPRCGGRVGRLKVRVKYSWKGGLWIFPMYNQAEP